ncbi:MAG: MerR family transcriptional regulator [Psychrobacter sp.]|nr:MerR family transcriptional regulator [Psychrobacter sp.]
MIVEINYLLIGQLAEQAGTTKDTIRHYDQMGLLKSRKRQAGSRHYSEYHPECIHRIKTIKEAQTVGFKLTEMRGSFNDYFDGTLDVDEQIVAVSAKLDQAQRQQRSLDRVIEQLTHRLSQLEQMKVANLQSIPRFEMDQMTDLPSQKK